MRVNPTEFHQHDFRVHTFLADSPLHDVWTFPLVGGGAERTIRNVATLLHNGALEEANLIVRSLFRLRRALGGFFGWDDARYEVPESSYASRLTEVNRARSLDEAGSRHGGFSMNYSFPQEMLTEIQNGTVHAFSAMTMVPTPEGYRVYWAIYVKRVSWLTPGYMACIDPFRRFLVYPAVIKRLQQSWRKAYSP